MKRQRRGFNRWFGLALAFVVAPLLTLFAGGELVDGSLRSRPYHTDPKDIRTATVVSSDYHSHQTGSSCTVTLSSGFEMRRAEVEDARCFAHIAVEDRVAMRLWRGDVTNIWDGPYSLWTDRNPDYQVHEWFPLAAFFTLGTLALMIWAAWNFRRNRPPPAQMSLTLD